jgi:hypothetical protein
MADGTVRHAHGIDIGDRVHKGGRVIGLLFHSTDDGYVTLSEGVEVAPGTVVLENGKLRLAGETSERTHNVCMNFLTEHAQIVLVDSNNADWTILDDQEVPDMEVHDRRDKKVIGR